MDRRQMMAGVALALVGGKAAPAGPAPKVTEAPEFMRFTPGPGALARRDGESYPDWHVRWLDAEIMRRELGIPVDWNPVGSWDVVTWADIRKGDVIRIVSADKVVMVSDPPRGGFNGFAYHWVLNETHTDWVLS